MLLRSLMMSPVAMVAVCAATLFGCASSPAERVQGACATASKTVTELPEAGDDITYADALPIVTAQADAAEQATTDLRAAGADDADIEARLLPAWTDLVAALRDLQDAIARPDRAVRYPGMAGNQALMSLDLYGSRTGLNEKADAVRVAADAVGVPGCGSIPWRLQAD